jgi:hypothetical protein
MILQGFVFFVSGDCGNEEQHENLRGFIGEKKANEAGQFQQQVSTVSEAYVSRIKTIIVNGTINAISCMHNFFLGAKDILEYFASQLRFKVFFFNNFKIYSWYS